jgi:hypothetical protein
MVELAAPTKNFPEKLLVLDVGCAWTKSFFLEVTEVGPKVLAKAYLPTVKDDLNFTLTHLFLTLSQDLKVKLWQKKSLIFPLVVVTDLDLPSEITQIASSVVSSSEARKSLESAYRKLRGGNIRVVDLGARIFNQDLPTGEINSYLTFPMNVVDLENYIGNKRLSLFTLPFGEKEVEIEQAIAKSAWRKNFVFDNGESLIGWDLILTGAVFSFSPKNESTALMILDSLPANVIAQAWLDANLVSLSFGALLSVYSQLTDFFQTNPASFDNFLELNNFKNLGTFVSLGGEGVVKVDFGFADLQEVKVERGQLVLLPISGGKKVNFKVKLDKKKITATLEGGEVGIVFDGRGKPLSLTAGRVAQEKVAHWRESLKKVDSI